MEGTRRDEAEVVDLAETEGARRASGVSATGGAALDPEVPAKAKRLARPSLTAVFPTKRRPSGSGPRGMRSSQSSAKYPMIASRS